MQGMEAVYGSNALPSCPTLIAVQASMFISFLPSYKNPRIPSQPGFSVAVQSGLRGTDLVLSLPDGARGQDIVSVSLRQMAGRAVGPHWEALCPCSRLPWCGRRPECLELRPCLFKTGPFVTHGITQFTFGFGLCFHLN